MAWEERKNGNRYYYHSIRSRDRVSKLYYGTGPSGELAAERDAEARALRHQEAASLRDLEARMAAFDADLDQLDRSCATLLEASLLAAAFRRTNYAWRHRRARPPITRGDPAAVR